MKTCSECGGKHYAKGFCKYHYRMPSQLNQTSLKRSSTSTSKYKPHTKTKAFISPISYKRKEALKRYRILRDKYFLEQPVCQFPECTSQNITLHHMKGRIGAFLTDKRYFKSLCLKHHRFVEDNPTEAVKLGLSVKRLDK